MPLNALQRGLQKASFQHPTPNIAYWRHGMVEPSGRFARLCLCTTRAAAISMTACAMCMNNWTKWSGGDCACSCSDVGESKADPTRKSISDGPLPTSTTWVLATGRRPQLNPSTWTQQPADWRDKGKPPVRFGEGKRSRALPTPINELDPALNLKPRTGS